MIDNLYQYRSYARCISEGYKFLVEHLWLVTKVMWPYFLIVSILAVCSNAVNTHANIAIMAGQQIYMEEVIAAIALVVLLVIAYFFTLRRIYIMFKRLCKKPDANENNATDTTKVKKSQKIKKVLKSFFRHIGKILGTTLLSLFLLVVISAIAYLPYLISTYTYFSSVEGQINFGDDAIIPTGGYVLMLSLCTLSYFIINMFSVAFYATWVFLYGSIRSQK